MSELKPNTVLTEALQELLRQAESSAITDVPAVMKLNRMRAVNLGMSMSQIGDMAGISSAIWCAWSTGKTSPTLANWERLMSTLAELEAKQ